MKASVLRAVHLALNMELIMPLTADANGVYPIAPTPFFENGDIDKSSIDRMVDFYLECGSTGMTVLGQLGEAPKLEYSESLDIASQVIQRARKLPVIVGVSAPGFASMRALTHEVMDRGAAGVMIAPPNTLRTDDQIVNYYHQAVDAIGDDVPFVLQDYTQTISGRMSPPDNRPIGTQMA
jgi:4-hydroxy-tetrahydrodipicolinate synthase